MITARPSYSRIKTALQAIQAHPELELQLVIAASAVLDRYGNMIDYIEKDGFKVTSKVFMVLEGENLSSMAKTTGIGIMELSTVFDNLNPDLVVTVADRFETMATAIAASYMNIPLVHIQGGEVTGNIDEKVRHAITKLSDLHLVSTPQAAERVMKMGEQEDSIHITGCPSIDLAKEVLDHPNPHFNPFEEYGGVGEKIDYTKGYLVVMQHPVTTAYQMSRKHIEETLYAIKELNQPTFWFWPNVDAGADGTSAGIRHFREVEKPDNIYFFKNMQPKDFLTLLINSKCLIGNSSVGIRECSFLGVPVINLGDRQGGRDRGANVIDIEYQREEIVDAVRKIDQSARPPQDTLYGDGNAGQQIADLLARLQPGIEKRLTY